MKSLADRLEDVISGKTYSESVFGEAKLHLTSDEQFDAIDRYLRGSATMEDRFTLQELVCILAEKGK